MRMALTGVAPDRIDLHTHAPFTLLRAALETSGTKGVVDQSPDARSSAVPNAR